MTKLWVKADRLLEDMDRCLSALSERCERSMTMMCIGRSHGQHAEPTTFGFQLLGHMVEFDRNKVRLITAQEGIPGDDAPPDNRAEFASVLALSAGSVERLMMRLKHLSCPEIGEVQEPGEGAFEVVSGLARKVCAGFQFVLGDMTQPYDLMREGYDDMAINLHFALVSTAEIIEGLEVSADQMLKNLEISGGHIYSQCVQLALRERGMATTKAMKIIQHAAIRSESGTFRENLLANEEVMGLMTEKELNDLFNPRIMVKHLAGIRERALKEMGR